MVVRIALLVFLVFSLVGCATGSKKQPAQAQPAISEKPARVYQQEEYRWDREDSWVSGSHEKAVKKSPVAKTDIHLSPKQIQRALKNAGYYQGPIDGKIGPKTKEAIVKFQKASALKADGIVGKRTAAELNKHLSR